MSLFSAHPVGEAHDTTNIAVRVHDGFDTAQVLVEVSAPLGTTTTALYLPPVELRALALALVDAALVIEENT